ncbi:MAG: hypothetical protein KGD63_04545 [Candidatus Lokiarchaeota archaeon]|nr:hypothetical protein [Candidatus Lokiarchaeota archaeon]
MNKDQNFFQKKEKLLESLVLKDCLKDKRLYKAFMDVPLEEFIPMKYREPYKIYEDTPNLFYFQNPENYRTISAPHMITIMLQGLVLENDDDLLILGAKSGYIAALAHQLAPKGEIIILEANSEIAKLTKENLLKLGLNENISVTVKNPLEGMPDLEPWQKILVTGAIKQNKIYPLLQQLDPNEGVLYAPIGEDIVQTYTQILRLDGNFYGKKQLQVRFSSLMTQIELDEIELITEIEEPERINIEINPRKVENTLSKITIKYETNIIDEFNLDNKEEEILLDLKQQDDAIQHLNNLKSDIHKIKNEDNIDVLFKWIKKMEMQARILNNLDKKLGIKSKKIQNYISQIRNLNIIRKELDNDIENELEIIKRKFDIINKQIEKVNKLEDLIIFEIKRMEKLE